MKLRLLAIFLLLVLVPLTALGYLVLEIQDDRQAVAAVELRRVFEARLADLDGTVARSTHELERRFIRLLDFPTVDPTELRKRIRSAPLVREIFVLAPDGRLTFPPDDKTTSARERAFLVRTNAIWDRRAILYDRPTESPDKPKGSSIAGTGDSLLALAERQESGWITWYWREGLHLLYWRRAADGGVVGVELERIVLLQRLIGQLPDTDVDGGRIALLDSRGDPIYQWGTYEPATDAAPFASRALQYPLDAWRLVYFLSAERERQLVGQHVSGSTTALGFGGVALALMLMAIYFYRESSRDMREAAARVTFVTQVSHELKTPLANIRLYAELLEDRLEDEDPAVIDRLRVIVGESHRLTRLINNILTYARQRRRGLVIEPRRTVLDDVVGTVLAQFGPALAEKNVEVTFVPGAPESIEIDPDAIGQVVANLVSNVEKYGHAGGTLVVTTERTDRHVTVTVADEGPGIPRAQQKKIFVPFHRVSSRLNDGVTGTGIGLSISRELAHKHGGDLVLETSERGARFVLRLPLKPERD